MSLSRNEPFFGLAVFAWFLHTHHNMLYVHACQHTCTVSYIHVAQYHHTTTSLRKLTTTVQLVRCTSPRLAMLGASHTGGCASSVCNYMGRLQEATTLSGSDHRKRKSSRSFVLNDGVTEVGQAAAAGRCGCTPSLCGSQQTQPQTKTVFLNTTNSMERHAAWLPCVLCSKILPHQLLQSPQPCCRNI